MVTLLLIAVCAAIVVVLGRLLRSVLDDAKAEREATFVAIERLLQRIQAPVAAVTEHGAREAAVVGDVAPNWAFVPTTDPDALYDEVLPFDEDLATTGAP